MEHTLQEGDDIGGRIAADGSGEVAFGRYRHIGGGIQAFDFAVDTDFFQVGLDHFGHTALAFVGAEDAQLDGGRVHIGLLQPFLGLFHIIGVAAF